MYDSRSKLVTDLAPILCAITAGFVFLLIGGSFSPTIGCETERRVRKTADRVEPDPVDVNSATHDEIVEHRAIPEAVAGEIVKYREAHGTIRTLSELDALPGVGPKVLARLKRHLFVEARDAAPSGSPVSAGSATIAPSTASEAAGPPAESSVGRIDLNQAVVETIAPVTGPKLAGKIVESRTARGRFRALEELLTVPGIGAKRLEKLKQHFYVN